MFAVLSTLGNDKIKKIKVYKSEGSYACPLKNNRSISYLQVRRYSTGLVGINGFLGPYLAGLIEGDGWFDKKQLHIIFSEYDTSLAYYLKKRIGYGIVYKIKEKKAVRYTCKHTKGLVYILTLINGKLVSKYKYQQLIFHNFKIL